MLFKDGNSKFIENECVIAATDLKNGIKRGEIGTVCQVYYDNTYLVDFDIDEKRIIDVNEDDLLTYEA